MISRGQTHITSCAFSRDGIFVPACAGDFRLGRCSRRLGTRSAARDTRCSRQQCTYRKAVLQEVPLPCHTCQALHSCRLRMRHLVEKRTCVYLYETTLADSFAKSARHDRRAVSLRQVSGVAARNLPLSRRQHFSLLLQACHTYAAACLVSLLASMYYPPCEQATTPLLENRRWAVFVCLLRAESAGTSTTCSVHSVGKYCMSSPFDGFQADRGVPAPAAARRVRGHRDSPTGGLV